MHKIHATRFYEHASILIPGGTLLAAVMVILSPQSPIQLEKMSGPHLAEGPYPLEAAATVPAQGSSLPGQGSSLSSSGR